MSAKVSMKRITLTVTLAGQPRPISASPIITTWFEVHVPNGNSGASVYIGDSTVSSAWIPRAKATAAGAAAGTYAFNASTDSQFAEGDFFDLSKIYVDVATGGDSVIVQYLSPVT